MRKPCCDKEGINKGAWSKQEDQKLIDYISTHGDGSWRSLPKSAGLDRCGKSCRLRWINYLRPDIKRGNFAQDEEELIIKLHALLGNRWSLIAGRLPGRTDNEVKNYWNSHIRKKLLKLGINPNNHRLHQNLFSLPLDHHHKVSTNNNANSCGSMNYNIASKVALKSCDHHQQNDRAILSDAASCFEDDDHETYNNSVAPSDLNLELTIAFPPSSSLVLEEKQNIKSSFNYMPREIMNHEHCSTIPNTLFLLR